MPKVSGGYRAFVHGQRGPVRKRFARALRDCCWITDDGVERVEGTVLTLRGGEWVPAFPGVRRG